MKIVYISSPYTLGDVAANVAVQIEAAHKIMDAGHCPVAPLLSHFLHLFRQRPYQDRMAIDLAIIPKMDVILRLPGVSSGADKEVAEAIRLGIPVAYGWDELFKMLTPVGASKHLKFDRRALLKGVSKLPLEDLELVHLDFALDALDAAETVLLYDDYVGYGKRKVLKDRHGLYT